MDMDFAKIMQMMNSMNGGGGNKDMAMLMQLLPPRHRVVMLL